MKFLERVNPSATAPFSLSRINNLPGLVMFLFDPILALREIRNNRDQEGQGPRYSKTSRKAHPLSQ